MKEKLRRVQNLKLDSVGTKLSLLKFSIEKEDHVNSKGRTTDETKHLEILTDIMTMRHVGMYVWKR